MLRKSLLIAFGLIAIVLLPSKAFALSITPIRYEISGDPGTTITHEMTLLNEGKNSQVYYASFANFEAQGETGSPTFVDPKDDLGTWMSTEYASVNLAPGQQKKIKFNIKIPKNAEPGGHFAAIFWGSTPGSGSGQISVGTKTGLLVLLTVNGDVKQSAGLVDFQIRNHQWGFKQLPVSFQYRFSNQGGDRVKPVGNVVVRSILGWRVKKVNANPFDGNVLPNTTRKFITDWTKRDSVADRDAEISRNEKYSFFKEVRGEWRNFAVGVFTARVHAEFGANHEVVKSSRVFFIIFPWELLLLIVVIVTPLYFLLRTLLRKYNKMIIKKAEERFRNQQSL
jgi:hypothetical protein